MSKTEHTPGPWLLDPRHPIDGVLGRDGQTVCRFYRDDAAVSADANLIAAAPELLQALAMLVAAIEGAASAGIDLTGYVGVGNALQAIAKARGRA